MRAGLCFPWVLTSGFIHRREVKSDSGSSRKPKSKLSHDLFASGSYEEEEDSDLFSPLETSKDLSKASPAPPSSKAGELTGCHVSKLEV